MNNQNVIAPQLRPYQELGVNGVRDSMRRGHKRVLVQASTGAGKTVTAASIIISAVGKGNRVLFLADTLELVDQAVQTFDHWGLDVGVMQGNHPRTDESCMVQVCTPHTISARLKTQRVNFERYSVGLIMVDECHVVYKARDDLAELYPNARFIGLTATPFTKGLGKFYTDVVEMIPMSKLIEDGFLAPYEAYGPDVPDMTGVRTSGGDYHPKDSEQVMSGISIVGSVLDTWKLRAEGKKTILFACNVAHSKAMAKMFQQAGYKAEHVDGYPTSADAEQRKADRSEVIDRFRSGETTILCNVAIATKGFDVPDIGCIILARPTKSEMLLWQMVGRGLRTAEGKDECVVLDHGGSLLKLGFPEDRTDFTLCDGNKAKSSDEKKEREERLPTPCPACSYLRPVGVHQCPKCKFAPEPQHEIVNVKGELISLREAQKKAREGQHTKADKDRWLRMFKNYEQAKGKKNGYSLYLFREKFGHEPEAKWVKSTIPPSKECLGWITNRNIRWAKTREKA